MRLARILILSIILSSILLGVILYDKMPDRMASHWNAKGEVDNSMSRFWGLFLMPLISLILLVAYDLLPRLDPLNANVEKFRREYDWFMALLFAFLLYVYTLTLFWNIGVRFSMGMLLTPAFAILFYYAGVMISKAKQNWFIGIRTPWTMADEEVWNKTHVRGALLFKAAGIICLLGLAFPPYAFLFILLPIISFSLYLAIYSYQQYKNKINSLGLGIIRNANAKNEPSETINNNADRAHRAHALHSRIRAPAPHAKPVKIKTRR